jgi:hypothetical protein
VNYVFGFGLLLVAGAAVVLFAMFGELYARVGGGDDGSGSGFVRLLRDVPVGRVPASWPADLARMATVELSVLLVLSPSCHSCQAVARELASHPDPGELTEFAILLSAADDQDAKDFVAEHNLSALPYHVDVGGTWVSTEFDVRSSPTALVFRDGRLLSGFTFTDFRALRTAVVPQQEPA